MFQKEDGSVPARYHFFQGSPEVNYYSDIEISERIVIGTLKSFVKRKKFVDSSA